ncbi:MAG: hypothetical protein HYY23_07770 [Verrucomicrobia bacterium]|nr:hypothetical protein [Verrucomicrobiota bacterium]
MRIQILFPFLLAFAVRTTGLAQVDVHTFGGLSVLPNGASSIELMGSAPAAFRSYFELTRLNSDDALLAGRLDLTRLGGMGWSLGNSDMGEVARIDERF